MREKAQMCYTDENLGKQMLITTVGINNQREQHMISTFKTLRVTKKVYMGWSKTPPVPAKPMFIRGFEAGKLDDEVKNGKNPVERLLRLDVLNGEIVHYGTIYVFDAILLADKITAIINVEE